MINQIIIVKKMKKMNEVQKVCIFTQKLETDLKENIKCSEEIKKMNENYKAKIDLLEKKTVRERQKSLIEYCSDKNSKKHISRVSENKSPIKKEGLTERKKYINL